MTVHCPHCLTGYELPRSFMGEHGARVRCPGCQGVFVVLPDGGEPARGQGAASVTADPSPGGEPAATGVAAPAPSPAFEPPATPVYAPSLVARAVLDVMIDFLGDALTRSRERGTVLSDHGPAIVAVWEEYRRRAGAEAPAAEFREVLRDRLGIDLSPRATS